MERFFLKKYPGLTTFLVLLVTYTLVYLYEKALLRLIHSSRENMGILPFDFWKIDLVSAAGPFLILLVIAALTWFILSYLPPNRSGPVFLLLFGVFVILMRFYHYLIFLSEDLFFPAWLHTSTTLGGFRVSFMNFGASPYQSSIFYLGTGSILIGIAALWRSRVEKRDSV